MYLLNVSHTLAKWEQFFNVSVAYSYHHQGMMTVRALMSMVVTVNNVMADNKKLKIKYNKGMKNLHTICLMNAD